MLVKRMKEVGAFNASKMSAKTRDRAKKIAMEAREGNFIIPNVHYTPEVTLNVLSLDLLEEQEYKVKISNNKCNMHYMFDEARLGKAQEERFTEEDGLKDVVIEHNKFLDKYFESIEPKDEGSLVKGLEELKWDRDDVHDYVDEEYISRNRCAPKQFNDAFEICNESMVINLLDYFANRPNGGSCSYTLNGRDGYLKLCYVALKYVVDAALEVVFHATSEETKVAGRVMAYYGKNFDYGCSVEVDDYKAMLFESKQPEVKPGKINLMRPVLSVPA
nr:aminoacyl-tRNA synthetase, class 1a, anticodon-binding [Tanacetum cinerariifolium]